MHGGAGLELQRQNGLVPFFIDSDNALGSAAGDIDDGYAIAAMLRAGVRVVGLSSVGGNTPEGQAYTNNVALARLCGFGGAVSRGRIASAEPVRVLALGPLTNVAAAPPESMREVICVMTNYSVRLPALRFLDFNQWQDPAALRAVLASRVPLTFVPCDVARRLRLSRERLADVGGELGEYLRTHTERWFRRARRLKGIEDVPLWDLTAAMYALRPELFEARETTLEIGRWGDARYGRGDRAVIVVTGFNPDVVWRAFRAILDGAGTG